MHIWPARHRQDEVAQFVGKFGSVHGRILVQEGVAIEARPCLSWRDSSSEVSRSGSRAARRLGRTGTPGRLLVCDREAGRRIDTGRMSTGAFAHRTSQPKCVRIRNLPGSSDGTFSFKGLIARWKQSPTAGCCDWRRMGALPRSPADHARCFVFPSRPSCGTAREWRAVQVRLLAAYDLQGAKSWGRLEV